MNRMSDITLEKIYTLLEKLTNYIMTEFPVIKENLDHKTESEQPITSSENYIADNLCKKLDLCLERMNQQSRLLDDMRISMQSVHRILAIAEKRQAFLKQLGHMKNLASSCSPCHRNGSDYNC